MIKLFSISSIFFYLVKKKKISFWQNKEDILMTTIALRCRKLFSKKLLNNSDFQFEDNYIYQMKFYYVKYFYYEFYYQIIIFCVCLLYFKYIY